MVLGSAETTSSEYPYVGTTSKLATGRSMGCVTEHGGDWHGMPIPVGVWLEVGGFLPVVSSVE